MGVTEPEPSTWPAQVVGSWIWGLEDSHLRVFILLSSLANPVACVYRSPFCGSVEVPARGLVTSLSRLAEAGGVSVAVVRGALARLAAGPVRDGRDAAITVVANPRGYTLITVHVPADSTPTAQPTSTDAPAPAAPAQHSERHSDQHSEIGTSTADSTAIVDGGQRSDQHSHQHTTSTATRTGDQLSIAGTESALSDQRSERSDPDQDLSVRDPADPPEPDDEPVEEPEDKAKARAARIPPRAWDGADYLRARILEKDPANAVGRKPWGKDVQRGLRLKWADTIRLMNTADGRDFAEIGRTINWLFDPKADHLFVVFAADSLRAKWDRIQEARRRAAKPAPSRPQAARPAAFVNPPERKVWK